MLALRRYGDHPDRLPLVMLHGFLCAGAFFRPNITALQRQHNLITIDLPGFGESRAIAPADSILAMARQVQQTLAAAGYERYHLLGHSMGGMVALQSALIAAAQIQSLIVYAGNSSGNLPERFESFAASKQRLQKDFAAAKRHICATWFIAGENNPHFNLVEHCSARVQLAAAEKALDAMAAFDISAQLDSIKQPVLIISAELDKTYSQACQRSLHSRIPQSRQRWLKGCAHCAHLEDEPAFNRIISEWLSAPPAG